MRGKKLMKKSVSLLAALLVLSGCTNSAGGYVKPKNQVNNPNKTFNAKKIKSGDEKYVESLQSFAIDFYQALDKKANQVFSPLSITTCYSMLYDGAEGQTKEELGKLLHYDNSFNHLDEIKNMLLNCAIDVPSDKTFLNVSQSLWSKEVSTFNDDYIDKMTEYYYAELFDSVNFVGEGGKLISDWINYKTEKFLDVSPKDFIFDINTEFVLLNTIYLKSQWAQEGLFDKKNNYDSRFYGDKNESNVTFMKGKVENSHFYKKDAYRIASLDYKQGIKLNILLPNEDANYSEVLGNETALKELLNFEKLNEYEQIDIEWSLPIFKLKQDYDLKSVLTNLGLTNATFGTPDLSSMTKAANLYISSSTHKAGMEINNDGVKAAAYTTIVVTSKTQPMPNKTEYFNVNHPFAYSITNSNGYPLFMGVINNL